MSNSESKMTQTDYSAIDIDELLEQRRQVAVIWSIEDVQEIASHLTDEQAWLVLQQCRQVHDCEFGLTWSLIESVADDMFPSADDDASPL
jgi:hypothetical protein